MKLMIVDDSAIIRKSIQRYLKDYNLEVVGEAGDGKAALELFKTARPEIITMDLTMPEMDGMTCLEEIIKIDDSVKIIVITALRDELTALQALQKGAKSFVSKPFTPESLGKAFKQVLETES